MDSFHVVIEIFLHSTSVDGIDSVSLSGKLWSKGRGEGEQVERIPK